MILILIFWLICFFIVLALLASNFYQLLILSDLEADYISPFESSASINYWVVPEMVLQGVLCGLFLLAWHWGMFLVSAPLAGYAAMLFMKKRHLIDVTEVFRTIGFEKKYRIIKFASYMCLLFIIIFRLILTAFNAIASDDDDFY